MTLWPMCDLLGRVGPLNLCGTCAVSIMIDDDHHAAQR